MTSHRLPWAGRLLALSCILLSAFNLRTAVTSLTPLLDSLGQTFGFGATMIGAFFVVKDFLSVRGLAILALLLGSCATTPAAPPSAMASIAASGTCSSTLFEKTTSTSPSSSAVRAASAGGGARRLVRHR